MSESRGKKEGKASEEQRSNISKQHTGPNSGRVNNTGEGAIITDPNCAPVNGGGL